MAEHEDHGPNSSTSGPLKVLIAGGGVAGLEAAFALRDIADEQVDVTLISPNQEFVYRPLSIGEPFSSSHADRYALAPLAEAAGAELLCGALDRVDTDRRVAYTTEGTELAYDALLVALGATPHPLFEHATNFDDALMDELLHGLVQDIEGGFVHRLAIVVPGPMPWPFPAYELALMASEQAWSTQVEMDITLLTAELMPLEAFGSQISRSVSELLAERRIETVTSAYCEMPQSQLVIVHPGGREITAQRVVALPQLRGPALAGLPQDGGGFIPVDEHGRVRRVDRVWAAGDATDVPIKHGGVAAQLADTAARSIAALAGVPVELAPFAPVLEGVLMTGGTPRYMRYRAASAGAAEESAFTEVARGADLPKIAARYLGPRLGAARPLAVSVSA